ncbi:MAG TPA: tetratricopeptide repeat protein, partial [Deltaproteobacteria bacterium]|nr:tetratricopeptide repeat protein [Deltaproteobacteria bacterium]
MNDTSSMIEKAEQLFGEGQTDQAKDLLIRALEIDPMLHAAHNDLGVILTHEGRLSEACNHYEKAIELAPDELTYQKNLAAFFIMQMNDPTSALRIYLEILRNDSDDLEAILQIGHLCAAGGDFFSARKYYWKALELDPENRGASCGLQDIYQKESERNHLPCRVQIISPSDSDQDPHRRKLWGDYWLKQDLAAELEQHGMAVVENDPDVIIAFIGVPLKELPRNAYKIAWVYSHPDMITSANLRQYDKIFCMSPLFIPKLEAMGYRDVELLIGATSKQPLDRQIEYDIVFVGNSRGSQGRQIVTDIGETPYNFKVWGNDWDNVLSEKYFAGRYFANEKLQELYATALISITDHHPDMAREGFLSNKIFDILASGGFAISDENACIQEIFGDTVPQYQSPEHLGELFDVFINNPEKRSDLMARGREIALRYNFKALAKRLISAMNPNRASHMNTATSKPTIA